MLSKLSEVIDNYSLESILSITFCTFYVLDLVEYESIKSSKKEEDVEKIKEINKKLAILRYRDDTIGFVDWRKMKRIYISSITRNVESKIVKHLKGEL